MNPLDFNHRLRAARDCMQIENHVEALRIYADLVRKRPGATALLGEYARAATIYGDFDLAEQLWGKIRASEPNTAELLSNLAWEHQQIRLHAKALELYRLAADAEPANINVQIGLAWIMARTASVAEGRPVVERCLELDAHNEKARFMAAQLNRREEKLEAAEKQFRDLLNSNPADLYVKYGCHSELAAIYERTGRTDEAMAILAKGKALPRENHNDEIEFRENGAWHQGVLDKVKSLPKNTPEIWAKSFPEKARKPAVSLALLNGSARSGTTLLERVLDAHPAVSAADESIAFTRIMPLVDITAAAIPAQRLQVWRQRYLNMLAKTAGAPGPGKLTLDKNPSRTIWLAAFLRVFPEVRIVMALRDPRDIVVSLYFQNHTGTNFHTFPMLAEYYTRVMDLWLAVREWSGFSWMETRYEDVVANLPAEGARVTKFLGLEWKDSQADFHQSNRQKPVMSTNYTGVSQPLYTRAVGRWRAYEKHLAPILPALEPYCKTFGYE